jgi:hypothetical protein
MGRHKADHCLAIPSPTRSWSGADSGHFPMDYCLQQIHLSSRFFGPVTGRAQGTRASTRYEGEHKASPLLWTGFARRCVYGGKSGQRAREIDPSLRLRVTPAGSSIRDHAVMLSRAKHLEAERDRPFAAAQGDTGRRLRVMFIARRSVAAAPGLGAPHSPCCLTSAPGG